MEKFGQYRDKGSGIAPFFGNAPPPSSPPMVLYHIFLFSCRLPFFIFATFVWAFSVRWIAAGNVLRKANLWCILGLPGVWWIDIRVDGAQRGSLGKSGRLPGPGTIIASSYTSPLDVLYLAAIFDPIFTQSYPNSRKVVRIGFEHAFIRCFAHPPSATPDEEAHAEDLSDIVSANPRRVIVVFPECTTSNGRGVLRLSPSLLSAGKRTPIFPISLRYTPHDVVTPIPGWREAVRFAWRLGSRQSHAIRVRIGFPLRMGQIEEGGISAALAAGRSPGAPPGQKISSQQLIQQQSATAAVSSASDRESEEDAGDDKRKAAPASSLSSPLLLPSSSAPSSSSSPPPSLSRSSSTSTRSFSTSSSAPVTPRRSSPLATPPSSSRHAYDTNFFDSFAQQQQLAAPKGSSVDSSTLDGLSNGGGGGSSGRSYSSSGDDAHYPQHHSSGVPGQGVRGRLTASEKRGLDAVVESLSRLGRVKTLGLGVEEKRRFVEAYLGGGANGVVAKKRR